MKQALLFIHLTPHSCLHSYITSFIHSSFFIHNYLLIHPSIHPSQHSFLLKSVISSPTQSSGLRVERSILHLGDVFHIPSAELWPKLNPCSYWRGYLWCGYSYVVICDVVIHTWWWHDYMVICNVVICDMVICNVVIYDVVIHMWLFVTWLFIRGYLWHRLTSLSEEGWPESGTRNFSSSTRATFISCERLVDTLTTGLSFCDGNCVSFDISGICGTW